MKQYRLQASVVGTVPTGTTNITDFMYYGCPITNITIPTSVIFIGLNAFDNTRLQRITIPGSVRTIGIITINIINGIIVIILLIKLGSYAFMSCSSLASVTISNGVRTIGLLYYYHYY